MKYVAAAVAGLLVFSGLILSTCEKRKTDVYAVVNGYDVKAPDFITEENKNDEEKKIQDLRAFIQKKVIQIEAEKLQTTEAELFSLFESLKTRNIDPKDVEKIFKEEFKDQTLAGGQMKNMLDAVREKQYDLARKRYINELFERSTILLVDDDGVFHSYKPKLN